MNYKYLKNISGIFTIVLLVLVCVYLITMRGSVNIENSSDYSITASVKRNYLVIWINEHKVIDELLKIDGNNTSNVYAGMFELKPVVVTCRKNPVMNILNKMYCSIYIADEILATAEFRGY